LRLAEGLPLLILEVLPRVRSTAVPLSTAQK
jgi:hypothetical protein